MASRFLYPLWWAQDCLRRFLNRTLYCPIGLHRRDHPFARCKDCGG